ncbi:NAD(+)/NADH kinase [bacterium]|nr:MAG: NAD(+)/NADH kinase [bacterium]
MHINFVGNLHRSDALEASERAAAWLLKRGHTVAAEPETARRTHLPSVSADAFGEADLVVAFGGDGTVIRAAHLASEQGTPILGVYYGRFGFVTQCTGEEIYQVLEAFFSGELSVERRMMLEAELLRGDRPVATLQAVNEAVLQRSVTSRMLTFDVRIDGYDLTRYPADGIIISTPTGSTAYNLSAGGPVMDPCAEALSLLPLSPHTLASRPLVLSPSRVVTLTVQQGDGDSVLSTDGAQRLHVLSGDVVRVRKSPRVTNLIRVEPNDFLIKLGRRLLWGQNILGDEPR